MSNGDKVPLTVFDDGTAACPICGEPTGPGDSWPWKMYAESALASFDTCYRCRNAWGDEDYVSSIAPKGEQERVWLKLRLEYLGKQPWDKESLSILESNLGMRRSELEAAYRDRLAEG